MITPFFLKILSFLFNSLFAIHHNCFMLDKISSSFRPIDPIKLMKVENFFTDLNLEVSDFFNELHKIIFGLDSQTFAHGTSFGTNNCLT